MFQLTQKEAGILRCQIGTSSWGGRRYHPRAFTEQGVAMLSSVLNSRQAVRVNIEIMRAFVRLRKALISNKDLAERMEKVEKRLAAHVGALGEHAEFLAFVEHWGLAGSGLGAVDVHLLAAAKLAHMSVWTRDTALARAAKRQGVGLD